MYMHMATNYNQIQLVLTNNLFASLKDALKRQEKSNGNALWGTETKHKEYHLPALLHFIKLFFI